MSGASAGRVRRTARGPIGVVSRWSPPTPRRRRRIVGITSALTRRRSARRRVGCLLVGRRRVRRPRQVIAMSGVSAVRVRRTARGPIGVVSRWSPPTPRRRRPIGCTSRARRPRRSARRRAASPPAGRCYGRRPLRAIAMSGVLTAADRRVGRGRAGVVPRSCRDTPSGRPRINATTRARPPRRSAARPVVRLMAGHRHSRVLPPATATCGVLVAADRRAGRGRAGAAPRSCRDTPSGRPRINATTRARRPRRSVPRPVVRLMAGHRRSRVLPPATATCGVLAVRVQRVARGPVGAVLRWFLNTLSVRRRINATTRARPPRRSAARRVGCLMAGRRHSRVLPPATATCGVLVGRDRRVGRGRAGAAPRSCRDTPSVRRRINATTRARPPRRSAARPVVRLMAGHRHSRVLPPATDTCGVSLARVRRVARGPVGVVPRSCRDTPSGRRRINATTRARPPRRSVPRPVVRLMAGHRRSRVLPPATATCGVLVAADRRAGRGRAGAAPRSCRDTPSVRRRINATTRARPPRRSAARPVVRLMAGHRRSRVPPPATATCGVLVAADRRAGRGRAGAAPRSCRDTPSGRRRINATTRARPPRRSAARPVVRLMAGHRRNRVLRRATATCGVSLARVQRVARGPVGVVQRWCLNTPSGRRRINAMTRARRPQRSAARPVECLMAGHRHSRVLPPAIATCGVSLARARREARGPVGAVLRWCLNTPSVRRRINATTRARRPQRSAARPVECLMAGRRHSRVLPPATATCGVSAARARREVRGPVGAVQRWCLNTPSGRRRINATTRVRPPRRSAARPAECLMAGHRHSRVLPPATATCGVSLARGQRVARGPVGVVQRSCLNTPSGRPPSVCTRRVRRPRRSPRRRVGCLPAGRRRSRAQTPMHPTCGASAARDRPASRGPIGAEPPSSIHGPRLRAVIATASNGSVIRIYNLQPSAVFLPAGPPHGGRPP